MGWVLAATAAALALAAWGAQALVKKRLRRYMPPAPAALRHDLEFWYYGIQPGELDQIVDDVTLVHESMWFGGVEAAIASMQRHGMRTMVTVQEQVFDGAAVRADAADRLRGLFAAFERAGVLQQVVALYLIDEPDGRSCTDDDVLRACRIARAVALEFPALAGVKLAVTYSYKRTLPGISGLDWVGLDDYGIGSGVLISSEWRELLARLEPHQRCYVVPGGASPWRQDPEAFRRWAHSTPQCMGVMAFMFGQRDDSGEVNDGIATNGMRGAYRALGQEIRSLRERAGLIDQGVGL